MYVGIRDKEVKAVETQERTSLTPEALEERLKALETELEQIKKNIPEDRITIVVFSGDMDKVFASMIIATGAAAMGYEVSLFFTFWGLSVLKKGRNVNNRGDVLEKAFEIMTPGGIGSLGTSKMNFMGLGPVLMKKMMKDKEVVSLEELLEMARESGVRMTACQMSMDVLGIKEEDLIDGLEYGGVAMMLGDGLTGRATLFV